MKAIVVTLFLALIGTTFVPAQKNARQAVTQVIEKFGVAASAGSVAQMEAILHPEFRVILNQFAGKPDPTLMDRAGYLGAMAAGKVGGSQMDVKVKKVRVKGHTAYAFAVLTTEKMTMHTHFSLVCNPEGKWMLISDMPFVEA